MITKLIIIRHGQSIGNLMKKFLGHTDLDLSELGYLQAQMVCQYLENEKIDAVYSSDLKRAYNTVLPIAKQRGLEVIKSEKLREIFAGDWEGMDYDEIDKKYEEEYRIWKTDIGNSKCCSGESVIELQERVYKEILKIAKENEGKTVCIGTHATPIRTLNAKLNGVNKDKIKDIYWPSNASVTVVIYENDELKMTEYSTDSFMGDNVTRFGKNV